MTEERNKQKKIFDEIMTKNFLKLILHIKSELHGQRTQSWVNAKKVTPRYIIFKLQEIKDKAKILKIAQ